MELVPWGAIGAGAGCLLAVAAVGARAYHQRLANATPNPPNPQTAEQKAEDLAKRRAEEEGRRQRAAIAARERAASQQRAADRDGAGANANVEDVELGDVTPSSPSSDPNGEASSPGVRAGGGGTPVLQATLSPPLPQTPAWVPEKDLGDPSPRAHLPDPLTSM